MSEGKRKLDLAPSASIDVVQLNNKVVSMRPVVKKAKVAVIHKLTRTIGKLRRRRGAEKKLEKSLRKVERLVEEIQVIKVLKADKISKYALGTTDTFTDLCRKPSVQMETRALARIAEHIELQKVVSEFREKHHDWKALAAYLLTKHTSREYKKKKKAEKEAKIATNVHATDSLVHAYLGGKLGESTEVKGGKSVHSEHSSDTNGTEDGSVDTSESDLSKESEHYTQSSDNQIVTKNITKTKLVANDRPLETKTQILQPEKLQSSTKTEEDMELNEERREMVVKRICLEDLNEESNIHGSDRSDGDGSSVPDILLVGKEEDNSKKKIKDSFFLSSDIEETSSDDDDDDDSFDRGDDSGDSYQGSQLKHSAESGNPFGSVFVGSLSHTGHSTGKVSDFYRHDRTQKSYLGGRKQVYDKKGRDYSEQNRHKANKFSFGSKHTRVKKGVKLDGKTKQQIRWERYHEQKRQQQSGTSEYRRNTKLRQTSFSRQQKPLRRKFSQNTKHEESRKFDKGQALQQTNKAKDAISDTAGPTEKIHPSWEASKKKKQQSQLMTFQGKKIKFDD